MKLFNKLVVTAGVVLFAGLSPAHLAAAVITLDIDETDGSPRLVVTNNTARCADGPKDCIEVKQGTQPHMFFKLNRACQPGGTEYGLSEFYIMENEKEWPASLDPSIASDFCADPGTGKVDLSTCGNNGKDGQLKIMNYNRRPATVYYQVIAKHCTSGETIELDPEIRNKGRG